MSESGVALVASGLTKRYGPPGRGLLAVDHIDLEIRQGEVFGFLGPNGAGKTTTIRMLTGLARPTSGSAQVLGLDLERDRPCIKKRIGVVPESSNLYAELTALDNLLFSMQLYGVPRTERVARAEALLSRFRLAEKRDTLFGKLSRGMKRALTVVAALAHRPEIVFLDEPTTGLDVVSARGLRETISGLREQGITVFLTTHYLEEAERLCDRIALLVKGRVIALDTPEGLKAQVQETTAVEVTLDGGPNGTETQRIVAGDVSSTVKYVIARAEEQGRKVLSIHTVRPTLEDAFVQLTGLSTEAMRVDKTGKGA